MHRFLPVGQAESAFRYTLRVMERKTVLMVQTKSLVPLDRVQKVIFVAQMDSVFQTTGNVIFIRIVRKEKMNSRTVPHRYASRTSSLAKNTHGIRRTAYRGTGAATNF